MKIEIVGEPEELLEYEKALQGATIDFKQLQEGDVLHVFSGTSLPLEDLKVIAKTKDSLTLRVVPGGMY